MSSEQIRLKTLVIFKNPLANRDFYSPHFDPMNIKPFTYAIISLAIASFVSCTKREFTCTLRGTVIDRKSDTLIAKRMNEDPRFAKIFIPIRDGKFEYSMIVHDIEAWELIFKDEIDEGGWRPVPFYPDQKVVEFELHPMDQSEKNVVSGGKVNQAKMAYERLEKDKFEPLMGPLGKTRDSLYQNHLYRSPEFEQILAELRSSTDQSEKDSLMKVLSLMQKDGRERTPAANSLEEQYKRIKAEQIKFRYAYMDKHSDLYSYSLLVRDLLNTFRDVDIPTIKQAFPAFSRKYPGHPYTKLISLVLDGADNIRVGGHYVDFTVPDLVGNPQTLSKLIEGQFAIIDLWATWCGPCIRNSRTLVPLYEAYHDKGFTVVGVAAEVGDTEAMKERLAKEKWPWIQLVELNHQNHIWDIYGASFGGGKVILVDKKGTILAINPSASEVEAKLKELL